MNQVESSQCGTKGMGEVMSLPLTSMLQLQPITYAEACEVGTIQADHA